VDKVVAITADSQPDVIRLQNYQQGFNSHNRCGDTLH
jgi:hypothetical protein